MTFNELKAEGIEAWYRSTQKVSLENYLRRWMFLNKWRLNNGISSTRNSDGSDHSGSNH